MYRPSTTENTVARNSHKTKTREKQNQRLCMGQSTVETACSMLIGGRGLEQVSDILLAEKLPAWKFPLGGSAISSVKQHTCMAITLHIRTRVSSGRVLYSIRTQLVLSRWYCSCISLSPQVIVLFYRTLLNQSQCPTNSH